MLKLSKSNFELQKSYQPQKKSENMYNKVSARKSKISCKKLYFFQFFSIFATYLRTPKIFNAQFSESSEKKIPKMILLQPFKYQKEQSHEFWSAQPQPCGNGRRIYVVLGTKCPTPSGIGLKKGHHGMFDFICLVSSVFVTDSKNQFVCLRPRLLELFQCSAEGCS